MRKMQQHQPEMKALQAKYKDDKQRQQQEMMKFYKENEVNPLALLPAAGRAVAGLHLAVLHAAQEPAQRHLPAGADARSSSSTRTRTTSRLQVGAGPVDAVQRPRHEHVRGRGLPLHQRHHDHATGVDADRPAGALRAARSSSSTLLMSAPTMDKIAAADDDVDAAGVRGLHHPLPGGPDRLLDHDEHLDDGPAVHAQAHDGSAAGVRRSSMIGRATMTTTVAAASARCCRRRAAAS